MTNTIAAERPDSADAMQLIAELEAELEPLYARESRHGYSVEKLLRENVAFFVARLGGAAACCGGVQVCSGEYGEVTSTSNCTDFQARRLGIRYKGASQKGTRFVHTLNGTAVAITRALVAILENCQQADGSVAVPEVLRPWVGKEAIVAKKA